MIVEKTSSSTDGFYIFADEEGVYFQVDFVDEESDDGYRLWEEDHFLVKCSFNDILKAISSVRKGNKVRIQAKNLNAKYGFGQEKSSIFLSPKRITIRTIASVTPYYTIDFDSFYLDTFSVLENSEPRKRSSRTILLSEAEEALLDIVKSKPHSIQNLSPRELEVFVGVTLTKVGFSNVRLSRFTKDGGVDLYAIYFEGDKEQVVVVEVKHYRKRKVGLEIVDRLNGVRDRENASKGILFTSSKFSLDAKKRYQSSSDIIALVDYERLIEILNYEPTRWEETKSGLWSVPPRK